MSRLSFGRDKRLLKPVDFQRVFDAPDVKVSTPELLLLARRNNDLVPRLGLVVAKKNAKLAVTRNRFKRLTRETFRTHQGQLAGLDILFLSRHGLCKKIPKDQAQLISRAFQKLIRKYQSDNATTSVSLEN